MCSDVNSLQCLFIMIKENDLHGPICGITLLIWDYFIGHLVLIFIIIESVSVS